MTPRDRGADDVAAAGREAGERFFETFTRPSSSIEQRERTQLEATERFYASVGIALGHGGKFDYQREGDMLSGYKQLRQFRDISNFNVGLYTQQAGMSLDEALRTAGGFAQFRSDNKKPDQPYGLDDQTAEFIRLGFQAGESGQYGPSARKP